MSSASTRDPVERGLELVRIFSADPAVFGRLRAVAAPAVPAGARGLLDHCSHMTAAMERFHGGPVSLTVVQQVTGAAAGRGLDAANPLYAREILLTRGDGAVVQYGIVRIDLGAVATEIAAAIREGNVPLGRILMDAGLLCEVDHVALLEIEPGPHLAKLFGLRSRTFGRVAEIRVDGQPAIELLEVVSPREAG
jgi:chorismate-pyruvate lyase